MENRKETLARVLRFAKPYRWYLLAALVSAVLSVSLTLYAPVLIGRGIDQIIAPGKVYFDNLLPILIELGIRLQHKREHRTISLAEALFNLRFRKSCIRPCGEHIGTTRTSSLAHID